MTTMYIFRGVPGSGKSTAATKLANELGIKVYEADMYFERDGKYEFNPASLGAAHRWCEAAVKRQLVSGHDVIVSNTMTRFKELESYLVMADTIGAKVIMVECSGNFQNVHNVPAEKVEAMRTRFQSNYELSKIIGDRFPSLDIGYRKQ